MYRQAWDLGVRMARIKLLTAVWLTLALLALVLVPIRILGSAENSAVTEINSSLPAARNGTAVPEVTLLPMTPLADYALAVQQWVVDVMREPVDSTLLPPLVIDHESNSPASMARLQAALQSCTARSEGSFTVVVFGGSNTCAHDSREPRRQNQLSEAWLQQHSTLRARHWAEQANIVTPMQGTVCGSNRSETLQSLRHCRCGCIPQRHRCDYEHNPDTCQERRVRRRKPERTQKVRGRSLLSKAEQCCTVIGREDLESSWASRLAAWLSDHTCPHSSVQVFNMCQGGSEASFVHHMLSQWFKEEEGRLVVDNSLQVDLVLMDYSVNDVASTTKLRAMHERVIRKLLPVVPILYVAGGRLGPSADPLGVDRLSPLYQYYNLPVVSYQFVNYPLTVLENQTSSAAFGSYLDRLKCNDGHLCWTGHELMGRVVIGWVQYAIDTASNTPARPTSVTSSLPAPLYVNEFASIDESTVVTSLSTSASMFEPHGVTVGWEWTDDKPGWVSMHSNASIEFQAQSCKGLIVVAFLKTYEKVGRCSVQVNHAGQRGAKPLLHATLDGLWERPYSLVHDQLLTSELLAKATRNGCIGVRVMFHRNEDTRTPSQFKIMSLDSY